MCLNVVNEYTYTLETIVQAGRQKIAQTSVPIRTNGELRPSRLFHSMFGYVKKIDGYNSASFYVVQAIEIFCGIGYDSICCRDDFGNSFFILLYCWFRKWSCATALIDYFGLILLVELFHADKMFSKVFITVFVIVINYVVGKKHVFKKTARRIWFYITREDSIWLGCFVLGAIILIVGCMLFKQNILDCIRNKWKSFVLILLPALACIFV